MHLGIKNGIFQGKNNKFPKLVKYGFWQRVYGAFSENSPLPILGNLLEGFPKISRFSWRAESGNALQKYLERENVWLKVIIGF